MTHDIDQVTQIIRNLDRVSIHLRALDTDEDRRMAYDIDFGVILIKDLYARLNDKERVIRSLTREGGK